MNFMSYPESCDYFRKKCSEWNSTHPHYDMKKYVNHQGKTGLVAEFRNDPLFSKLVCPFLKQYAQGQEKDMTSSIIKEATSLLEGDFFTAEIDIIVISVLEACGYEGTAMKLVKGLLTAIIIAGAITVVASALKKK